MRLGAMTQRFIMVLFALIIGAGFTLYYCWWAP
jgi:hypothetical protein